MNILVVGSCNMDLRYELSHLPEEGETLLTKEFHISRGGKGQNQAVCAAKLGAKVFMIAALGEDEYGNIIYSSMEREHINLSAVKFTSTPTGTASIYVDPLGHNNIVVHPGANFSLTPEDLERRRTLFSQADFCILQLELPLHTVYKALDLCEQEQVTVILNPAPANENFDPSYYSKVDYLIPNEREAGTMLGEKYHDKKDIGTIATQLLQLGAKHIIVTLGEQGSYFLSSTDSFFIKAKKVSAIDTTAAGDAFIGAFVSHLAQKKPILDALNFATTVSALTVTKKGAIDSLPTPQDLKIFSDTTI